MDIHVELGWMSLNTQLCTSEGTVLNSYARQILSLFQYTHRDGLGRLDGYS